MLFNPQLVDKGVLTLFRGISLKGKALVQPEIKLAYNDVAVQYVSHYAKGTGD